MIPGTDIDHIPQPAPCDLPHAKKLAAIACLLAACSAAVRADCPYQQPRGSRVTECTRRGFGPPPKCTDCVTRWKPFLPPRVMPTDRGPVTFYTYCVYQNGVRAAPGAYRSRGVVMFTVKPDGSKYSAPGPSGRLRLLLCITGNDPKSANPSRGPVRLKRGLPACPRGPTRVHPNLTDSGER